MFRPLATRMRWLPPALAATAPERLRERHAKDVVSMETDDLLLSVSLGIAVLAASSLLLKGLWNSTLPAVLGLNPVDAWQAFKILLIAAMVFGSHHAFGLHERASGPERGAEIAVDVAESASTR
jgi:hypothetical protein